MTYGNMHVIGPTIRETRGWTMHMEYFEEVIVFPANRDIAVPDTRMPKPLPPYLTYVLLDRFSQPR